MKIFSNKTFQFDHPTGDIEPVVVQNNAFDTVPDWVEDSAMFKLASADGDITIINNKGDELTAEKGDKLEKERKSAEAKAAVTAAETEPNRESVDLAHDLITDLPNGTQKTSFIKRIAAVEATLAEKPKV
jgi:hypothetical protein